MVMTVSVYNYEDFNPQEMLELDDGTRTYHYVLDRKQNILRIKWAWGNYWIEFPHTDRYNIKNIFHVTLNDAVNCGAEYWARHCAGHSLTCQPYIYNMKTIKQQITAWLNRINWSDERFNAHVKYLKNADTIDLDNVRFWNSRNALINEIVKCFNPFIGFDPIDYYGDKAQAEFVIRPLSAMSDNSYIKAFDAMHIVNPRVVKFHKMLMQGVAQINTAK